ncbi:ABC transporter ATP-binding protein [Thermopolyspora sp. NPDC052614]|uniref:ABC transporter ATP-binding protein n=1 Tax=Thermopolyspora sp. NPDC052614 TaxID=3155682 RepID=UPI003420089A
MESIRHVLDGLAFVWRASRRSYLSLLVISALAGLAAAAIPLAAVRLIDGLTRGLAPQGVALPLALLAVAIAVERVLGVLREGHLALLAFDVRAAAERVIVDTASRVEVEAFEHAKFYDCLERASRAASLRPTQIADSLLNTVTALAGGIGTALAVISLEPRMFGVALISFLPVWWIVQRRSAVRLRFIAEATPTEREAAYFTSVLTDRDGAKELRLFRAVPFFDGKRMAALARRQREIRREVGEVRRVDLIGLLLAGIANCLTWGILIVLSMRGLGDPASLIAFIFAFQRLKGFLTTLSWGLAEATEAATLLNDMRLLREWEPEEAAPAGPLPPLREITLRQVRYTYPHSARPALSEVSATFRRGEFVAVVGANGSGKSTLIKILTGLLRAENGELLWNGAPADRASIHRRAGAVFQDSCQFALSVRENVTLGRDGHDLAGLLARLDMTQTVDALADGPDTMLGRQFEGGTDLSGGQWQRLMIARGLFDDRAEMIILDEASSALDPVAEYELVRTVKRLCRDKLVVVVSHRLSSIAEADRVIVLDEGRVVQEGTVRALLDGEGVFADMFNVQARTLGLSRTPR